MLYMKRPGCRSYGACYSARCSGYETLLHRRRRGVAVNPEALGDNLRKSPVPVHRCSCQNRWFTEERRSRCLPKPEISPYIEVPALNSPQEALGARPRTFKKCNEVEPLFCKLKGFRRIDTIPTFLYPYSLWSSSGIHAKTSGIGRNTVSRSKRRRKSSTIHSISRLLICGSATLKNGGSRSAGRVDDESSLRYTCI